MGVGEHEADSDHHVVTQSHIILNEALQEDTGGVDSGKDSETETVKPHSAQTKQGNHWHGAKVMLSQKPNYPEPALLDYVNTENHQVKCRRKILNAYFSTHLAGL